LLITNQGDEMARKTKHTLFTGQRPPKAADGSGGLHVVTSGPEIELYRDINPDGLHSIYLVPPAGPMFCIKLDVPEAEADLWYAENPAYAACTQTRGSTGPQIN
jgi:hypothetical protein